MWLCQPDTVSCLVLGAPQVKGRTWLWSVGDNQSGAGAKSCAASSCPISVPLFRHDPPDLHLRTHPSLLLLPARSSSSTCSWQGFLQGHLSLSISRLGWVGTAPLCNAGTGGMVGRGGSSLQSSDLGQP